MKKTILLLLGFVAVFTLFQACQKSGDARAESQDVTTSEDLATNEDFSEQIDLDADLAVDDRGNGGTCPTVTAIQPWGTWPNTITIDFGDACTRPDGRVLKGKVIVTQTGEMRTPGAQRTLTHENFFVDDVQVEGTKVRTNNGLDANGLLSFTKTATGMKLSYPDGTTTSWDATRTSTLIEGFGSTNILDNVWSITGNATGVNRNGVAFTATITSPLRKRALCRWISEGVTVFTRGDRTATLDFGNGDCDRFGTLTLNNGDTRTIRLRR